MKELRAASRLRASSVEARRKRTFTRKDLEAAFGHAVQDDTLTDFNKLVSVHLIPKVEAAKHEIDMAVKNTAVKIRAWALLHLDQAKKLGRPTALFEKILNDPKATASQLARHFLGDLAPPKDSVEIKEEKALNDVLDNISLF